jgi:opacity protein-like surface antigen
MGTVMMVRWIAFSTAMFSVISLAMPAQAEWYAAAALGAVIPHNLTNNEGSGSVFGVPADGMKFSDISLSSGFAVDGKLGYFLQRAPWLGLEAEVLASRPKAKAQTFSGQSRVIFVEGTITAGDVRVIGPALNVILRYPGKRLQPYIGGGPMVAFIKTFDEGDTSSEIGFNVLGGIRLLLSQRVGIFAEGKYMRAGYSSDHGLAPTLNIKGDYSASHILVGTSFHF